MLTLLATGPEAGCPKKRSCPDPSQGKGPVRKKQRTATFDTLKLDFSTYLKRWDKDLFPKFSWSEFGQKFVISEEISSLKKGLSNVLKIDSLFKKVTAFKEFLETNVDKFTLENSITLIHGEITTVEQHRKQIEMVLKEQRPLTQS